MSQSKALLFPLSTVGNALPLLECGLQFVVEVLGRATQAAAPPM